MLDLIPDICVVVLVMLGAWRVAEGHITPGQLVQAVALFGILVFPLRVIGFFFGDLPPSVVAHDRIAGVLAQPLAPARGSLELPPGALSVRVHDATVDYGGQLALDRVTFSVEPGETLAIVGPTGSGKSTLLMAIADMIELTAGTVEISGMPVPEIAAGSLTHRVGLAWQEPFLLDGTITDNVAFGPRLSDDDVRTAVAGAAFDEVVAGLPDGYSTRVGERGVRLSGGQRQRLALARAFARRPGLLLLDDATSAVDPVVEQRILRAIRDLDTTLVIVAHRRSTIELADRVAMVQRGRLVHIGAHAELMTVPDYVALLEAYEIDRQETGA